MGNTGDPGDEDLAESAQRQNLNLRRLIDAVGTLLAGSREVLSRLQVPGKAEPPDTKPQPDAQSRAEQATDASPPNDQPPGSSNKS